MTMYLLVQSSQDLGMAVALVHSGVGAEKVVVLLAINVPDMHALAAVQDNCCQTPCASTHQAAGGSYGCRTSPLVELIPAFWTWRQTSAIRPETV